MVKKKDEQKNDEMVVCPVACGLCGYHHQPHQKGSIELGSTCDAEEILGCPECVGIIRRVVQVWIPKSFGALSIPA